MQIFAANNALRHRHAIRQSDLDEPGKGASRDAEHVPSARLALPGMS
jgi:hypothetical protein